MHAVVKFRLSLSGWLVCGAVIFCRMSFVIGNLRRVEARWKTLRAPFISLFRSSNSKTAVSRPQSIWKERSADRYDSIVPGLTWPKSEEAKPYAQAVIHVPNEVSVAGQLCNSLTAQKYSYEDTANLYPFLVPADKPFHKRFAKRELGAFTAAPNRSGGKRGRGSASVDKC